MDHEAVEVRASRTNSLLLYLGSSRRNQAVVPRFSPRGVTPATAGGRNIPPPDARRCKAFSLIELLTVSFILVALIAILIPSLNAARIQARKTSTLATFNALKVGLVLFRNDNERRFVHTHGYPPSFSHPRMLDTSGKNIFDPHTGQFPFHILRPVISGAHWLPAMLMGVDGLGYIKDNTVPERNNLRDEPWRWYTPDPLGDDTALERAGHYVAPDRAKTVRMRDIPGRANAAFFKMRDAHEFVMGKDPFGPRTVFVDAFGRPILYYAANANGRTTNMVSEARDCANRYAGGPQEQGSPVYVHQDNQMFTGNEHARGWIFTKEHKIANPGEKFTAAELVDPENTGAQESFARFIVDRGLYRTMWKIANEDRQSISSKAALRPANADSYLLISAGADGIYGSGDDITNFPLPFE